MTAYRVRAGRQGGGRANWTGDLQVKVLLSPDDFAKVRSRAEALEVGNSAVVRQIVEAWCRGEPPPLFIGAGEHS